MNNVSTIIISATIFILGIASLGAWFYVNNKNTNLRIETEKTKQSQNEQQQRQSNTQQATEYLQSTNNQKLREDCEQNARDAFEKTRAEYPDLDSETILQMYSIVESEIDRCYERYPVE